MKTILILFITCVISILSNAQETLKEVTLKNIEAINNKESQLVKTTSTKNYFVMYEYMQKQFKGENKIEVKSISCTSEGTKGVCKITGTLISLGKEFPYNSEKNLIQQDGQWKVAGDSGKEVTDEMIKQIKK